MLLLSSFDKITTFEVPDGTTTLFGFDTSFLKSKKLISHPKGVLLFIHGFNSSAQIWGNEDTGFVSESVKQGYLPFVIDFSDSFKGSIVNLSDYDVFYCFKYIQEFYHDNVDRYNLPNKHFIAQSMGGIILRYFLSLQHTHKNHNPADFQKMNFRSAALLGVPNHGISKANSDNLVSKMDKIIKDFNSFAGEKFSVKLVNKAFYQLLSGNPVIETLLKDLPTNMWPQLQWLNFIAKRDIVVDRVSSYFPPEEVAFLMDHFHQEDFDATHMKNPLHSFTDPIQGLKDSLQEKMPFADKNILAKIEKRTPDFLGILTKDPIYANKDLIKTYFNFISKI